MQTGTVARYYKTINQVSVLYLQRWPKKVRKTDKKLEILLGSMGATLEKMNRSH
jgi:hypothetical protein